jgi:S-formylglutathione hydrolase FrmB
VVMPDRGTPQRPGWYSDWFNFGELGSPRWRTFHLRTVLPYVDRGFRTIRDRDFRVVAGLAMGGFGTMPYAARHPHLFAGADQSLIPARAWRAAEHIATRSAT